MPAPPGRPPRTPLAEEYPLFPYHPEMEMEEIDIKGQRFARNLIDLIETFIARGYCSSVRDFARKVGMSHTVIISYTSGKTWIDGRSLARLETITGQPLWERQNGASIDRAPRAFTPEDG